MRNNQSLLTNPILTFQRLLPTLSGWDWEDLDARNRLFLVSPPLYIFDSIG